MKVSAACFVIFLSVFYAVGFALLAYSLWAARRSTLAGDWPTTRGTLTKVALEDHSDDVGTTYVVKVEYTCAVDGTAYTGSCLAFGYAASSGRQAHEEIYEKLKNAKAVDVRYDPNDPSSSTLSFGMHRSIQLVLIFAIT